MGRETWRAAVHGITESDMTQQLNWTELFLWTLQRRNRGVRMGRYSWLGFASETPGPEANSSHMGNLWGSPCLLHCFPSHLVSWGRKHHCGQWLIPGTQPHPGSCGGPPITPESSPGQDPRKPQGGSQSCVPLSQGTPQAVALTTRDRQPQRGPWSFRCLRQVSDLGALHPLCYRAYVSFPKKGHPTHRAPQAVPFPVSNSWPLIFPIRESRGHSQITQSRATVRMCLSWKLHFTPKLKCFQASYTA